MWWLHQSLITGPVNLNPPSKVQYTQTSYCIPHLMTQLITGLLLSNRYASPDQISVKLHLTILHKHTSHNTRVTTMLVSPSYFFMQHLFQVPFLRAQVSKPVALSESPPISNWRTPAKYLFLGCFPLSQVGVVAWSQYCCVGVVSHRLSSLSCQSDHVDQSHDNFLFHSVMSKFGAIQCKQCNEEHQVWGSQNQIEKTVL